MENKFFYGSLAVIVLVVLAASISMSLMNNSNKTVEYTGEVVNSNLISLGAKCVNPPLDISDDCWTDNKGNWALCGTDWVCGGENAACGNGFLCANGYKCVANSGGGSTCVVDTVGSLTVNSTQGASVYVNDELKGTTSVCTEFWCASNPGSLKIENLPVGNVAVRVTKEGYYEATKSATILGGKNVNLVVNILENGKGGLTMVSKLPGVSYSVYVDNTYKANGVGNLDVLDILLGSRAIKVTSWGYTDFTTTATVTEGQYAKINVNLVPTKPTLQVFSGVMGAYVYADTNGDNIQEMCTSISRICGQAGTTQAYCGYCTFNTAGTKSVKVTATGYKDFTSNSVLSNGKVTSLTARLVKA